MTKQLDDNKNLLITRAIVNCRCRADFKVFVLI